MNILQVSLADIAGGAEKVAWNLFQAYKRQGHKSVLVVGIKHLDAPDVVEIPNRNSVFKRSRRNQIISQWFNPEHPQFWVLRKLRFLFHMVKGGLPEIERQLGLEDFNYPASRQILKLMRDPPDILHAHNLHGNYFDLRALVKLSYTLPVIITLHDEWMLTGHCAYSLGCMRWQTGCGRCPDLTIYPAISRDATAWNWKRKRKIYNASLLWVSTPSHWLMNRVQSSMLKPIEGRVIPYGVDLEVFRPGDQLSARSKLNLPAKADILLFASHGGRLNPFKNYAMLEQVCKHIAETWTNDRPLIFLVLGSQDADQQFGEIQVRHIPFQSDSTKVAQFYQAADIFVHAAKSDNFPNTILEAFACGKPVIATDVGGISEQIDEGSSGYLIPPSDVSAMTFRITQLLQDKALRDRLGRQASEIARQRFDLKIQAATYLAWYQEIIERWKKLLRLCHKNN